MKTLYLACLLTLLLAVAAVLPAAPVLMTLPRPAGAGTGWVVVARYRALRDTELPALLAWLRDRGPFTRPDVLATIPAGGEVPARQQGGGRY